MKTVQITPELVRQWLEALNDTGVIPWQMKVHLVYIAIAYLKVTEMQPLMFDPLDYMLRDSESTPT